MPTNFYADELRPRLTRRRCENDTERFRIVFDTIVFGQNDICVFTRRRCTDVQRCLRLVRRRSRASSVERQRLQNVIGRGLGHCHTDWDPLRLKHIMIRRVFPTVSKNLHHPSVEIFNSIARAGLLSVVLSSWSPADVLYIELCKATATAPERPSTKLTD